MGDSDIRIVHPLSNPNRGMRADGNDASSSQVQHDLRIQDQRKNAGHTAEQGGLQTRATDLTTGNQRITGGTGKSTGASHATTDNFGTVNASAWEKFMSEMLGAMDVALSTEDAAKDGKIDSSEWNDIFAKAGKDGQVSLLEMSAMYAGLQDMHDKGAITDDEYKGGVAGLERELSARYGGGKSNGLDDMAKLYIQVLEGGGGIGDHATGAVSQDQHAQRLDVANDVNDNTAVDRQQLARRIVNNDDDASQQATRVMNRRTEVNNQLATALTDIGINRHVPEVTSGRGTEL